MKKLMVLTAFAALCCASTVSFAQEGPVILGPASGGVNMVAPVADGDVVIEPIPAGPIEGYPVQPVALYHNVKVDDPHHIHPCAVPMVIQVPDPCQRRCCDPCDPCSQCCGPQCVNVQICVPPCGCPKIKTRDDGRYVKYDYGKYRIEITSRNGRVKVDYDD